MFYMNQPLIWIHRIVLLKSLSPMEIIRDVSFTCGLNIIWGKALPEETASETPITISGHSVGKTTLCRLIRYCLGESHFGTEIQERAIRTVLPISYVCAEIIVDGTSWIVLRPLCQGKKHLSSNTIKFEDVLLGKEPELPYSDFLNKIETVSFKRFPTQMLPDKENKYSWVHLLSWLTRDQETRFSSIWEWRSSKSKSTISGFTKKQAQFLMRMVLGLIHQNETTLTSELNRIQSEITQTEDEIKELKKKPSIDLIECETVFYSNFGISTIPKVNNDLFSLEDDVNRICKDIQKESEELNRDLQSIENDLLLLEIEARQTKKEMEKIRAALSTEKESDDKQNARFSKLNEMEEMADTECRFGFVKYSECQHFAKYLNKLKKKKEEWEKINSKDFSTLSEEMQLEMYCSFDDFMRQKNEAYNQAVTNKEKKLKEKRVLNENLASISVKKITLQSVYKKWKEANDFCNGQNCPPELDSLNSKLVDLKNQIDDIKIKIELFQSDNQIRLKEVSDEYDALVKRVLSKNFKGEISYKDGEISFKIAEDAGYKGEAVETLALVIADISVMLSSITGNGLHPGFIIHDSPREADLDNVIYNRFLNTIYNISSEKGGIESPFQYIVTTTSPPPKSLKNNSIIRLELQGQPITETLFRCSLRPAEAEQVEMLL